MPHNPSFFHSDLTDDRLSVIAEALLDIRFTTIQEMQSEFDSNFSREVAAFERSKNMLISMCMSKSHKWLSLLNPGMDVTFCIGGVPCRFFRDDPESPDKKGFFKRNAVDDMFSEDDGHPVIWRFVIERAEGDESEDRAHFIGYNVYQEKVSQWTHGSKGAYLHSVGGPAPAPKTLLPAQIDILEDDIDNTGNNDAVNE
ncbi:hypothetical protein NM213_05005 [Pseudomonas lactis]|uniref:hypothetical protein n=1 Tax=Pseudomonas TaxID=286 RepID=UPI00249C69DF|nr:MULTISPECIES: hypothetical protein [Pseudomonas]MDR8369269.1 hypothetical protein [Pseudomonas lactis]